MKKTALFLSLTMIACDGQINLFGSPTQIQGVPPKASPSPSPSPSPTATPNDPCAPPVTAVHLSGPLTVGVGEVFKVDVTPVNASGPLQGELDYCNLKGRTIYITDLSLNLRCVGQCNGFGPQFLAQGVGPFSMTIHVDSAASQFSGTVLKP